MLYLKTSYTSASICTNEVVISCSKFLYEHGLGIQNETLIFSKWVRVNLPCTHLDGLETGER